MKLSIIILSSVFLFLGVSAQQTCTNDYQCSATYPYGQCSGSVNDCTVTNSGIAVDATTNTVYWITQCRGSSVSDPYGNTTIKKVSADGGLAQTVYTEGIIPAAGNIGKIYAEVNGYIYYDRSQRAPGSLLEYYIISTGQSNTVPSSGFFQSELDIADGETYSVNLVPGPNGLAYEVDRYTAIIGQSTTGTGTKLYSIPSIPGPVRRGAGSDLIFTIYTIVGTGQSATYTTTFYKGSIEGGSSLPSTFFTVNDYVSDFDVDSTGTILVYGTPNGLFKRVGATTTTLSSESTTGVAILGNKVIYNNGVTVRSAQLNGSGLSDLVQAPTGKCICRNGFSGSNCQTCTNGQVQWNNGTPSCVALNSAGVPVTCSYDYQCGNVPYTVCNGSCNCRANFTGSRCDQCNAPNSITFTDGIPTCA